MSKILEATKLQARAVIPIVKALKSGEHELVVHYLSGSKSNK